MGGCLVIDESYIPFSSCDLSFVTCAVRSPDRRGTRHLAKICEALVVTTGEKTGRSANDKFFVKEKNSQDKIHWGDTNVAISEENFNKILKAFEAYAQEKELYVHDLYGGADRDFTLPVTIITEFAWHGLFSRHMLVRPTKNELENFSSEFTIINFQKLCSIPYFCRKIPVPSYS